MPILDHRGNPVSAKELDREQAQPTAVGIRSVWRSPQVKGLTPAKLASILRTVDSSNQCDEYLVLAEEMEEKDLHYASVLRTRKLAVSRLTASVEAVSDEDADVEDAEFISRVIKARPFKKLLFHALDALGKGYSMVEILWDLSGKHWLPKGYKWRDPRYFRYDIVDLETPRLITIENIDPGIPLPAFKFIYHVPEIKSGVPLRGGLARLAAFAFMCKSYSVKDWMAFAEVYGMPLRLGRYEPGASEEDIRVLKTAIQDLGHDAGAVIPETMLIEFIDAARMTGSGSSKPVFGELAKFLNSEVSKGVLGQTMTADDGSSRSQAEVHQTVREDIRDNDAEQLAATIQRDLVNPIIDLNFGPREQHEYPVFGLAFAEPEDLKSFSDAITPLIKAGLRVEAQPVRDKFGLEMPAEDAEIIGMGAPPAEGEPEPAPEPTEPPEGEGPPEPEPEEQVEQRALRTVINALAKYTPEEIDSLTDAEADDWKAQLDPIVKPILALAERSRSYDEFTEQLDGVLGEMDDAFFIERLATTTYKARGLGDARDSPAELASMSMPDALALMAEATTVQSVIFDKEHFTHAQAVKWLRDHDFKAAKTDEKEKTFRFRQRDPGDFQDGSFRTITLTTGVKAIIGRLK